MFPNSHNPSEHFIQCKKSILRGFILKEYIKERTINIANYIIEDNDAVRQTAKELKNGTLGWKSESVFDIL